MDALHACGLRTGNRRAPFLTAAKEIRWFCDCHLGDRENDDGVEMMPVKVVVVAVMTMLVGTMVLPLRRKGNHVDDGTREEHDGVDSGVIMQRTLRGMWQVPRTAIAATMKVMVVNIAAAAAGCAATAFSADDTVGGDATPFCLSMKLPCWKGRDSFELVGHAAYGEVSQKVPSQLLPVVLQALDGMLNHIRAIATILSDCRGSARVPRQM